MKKFIFRIRLSRAIRKANRLKKKYKFKYLVLMIKGKPRVYAKFQIKNLIKRGFLKKGISIQHIESLAIYKTL